MIDGGPAPPAALIGWVATRGGRQVLTAARALIEAGRTGDRSRVPADLDAVARRDVGRLLGVTWQASARPLTLGQLRHAVVAAGSELTDLLVYVGGPLRDRPSERAELAGTLQRRRDRARAALTEVGTSEVVVELVIARRWLGAGTPPELPERAQRLARVLGELTQRSPYTLPGQGILLASLASDLFADPHALDRDTMLGRAAARVLAAQAVAKGGGAPTEVASAADAACASTSGWRTAWADTGVTCDQLSSTVLVLNLPLPGGGPAAALLRAAAAIGEPVWLTARSLAGPALTTDGGHVHDPKARRDPLIGGPAAAARAPSGSDRRVIVRVCENPSIVESAADRLGVACPPLVCTYGRPSTAAWLLLTELARRGATLLVSADRDSAGDSIVRDLLARLPGSRPWLPSAPGRYEEDRLTALLADLSSV